MRRPAYSLKPASASAPSRRAVGALFVTAVALAACGDDTAEVAPGEGSAVAAPTAAPAPADGPGDVEPPSFDGLTEVALLEDGAFQLRWAAATDNLTGPEAIRYEVFHTIEPFGEPDPVLRPLATSAPGATEHVVRAPLDTGRFFVRAVDAAGNASGWGVVLEQRARRPWTRAEDGTLVSELAECEVFEPGRAVCVGAGGYAARWDRDHWTRLEASDAADLKLADVPGGLLLFSPVGHLYQFEPNGPLLPVSTGFVDQTPRTPLRQVAEDFNGLRYWIDAEERVFVGVDSGFRPMERPIGVELEGCRTLRGLGFNAVAGFAVCGDGAVYSVSAAEPGMRWLSLTANTPVDLPRGLAELRAPHDTQATVVTGTELRRVSVGGWSLLVDAATLGADELGRPVNHEDRWYVPSSAGVVSDATGTWGIVPGTQGDVVGVLAPTALEPADQLTAIFSNGAVGRVRRGQMSWVVEAGPTGFALPRQTPDGLLALASDGTPGVFRHDGTQWRRVADAPPLDDGTVLAGLGPAPRGLYAWGVSTAGDGVLLESAGRGWTGATLRYIQPPPPVDPDVGMVFDEPMELGPQPVEPLAGVDASRLDTPQPRLEAVLDVAITADGRAAAGTATGQMWWRIAEGWLLVADLPNAIDALALDAGDAWVAVSGGTVVRCWRDRCDAEVPQPAEAPMSAAAWWHDAEGLTVLDDAGAVWRFVAAEWTDGATARTTPMETTPVGTWQQVAAAPAAAPRERVVQRLHTDAVDVVWTDADTVVALRDGRAITLAERPDGLALVRWRDGWALLTEIGLLTLGEVVPARPAP